MARGRAGQDKYWFSNTVFRRHTTKDVKKRPAYGTFFPHLDVGRQPYR